MKISYNWLKDYTNIDLSAEAVAEILTDTGLEVEGIEEFESIKGSLEGVVIGEVLEVSPHPNADRLNLTKIDVGHADPLPIVCGAPNVAEGQKVVVALVGSTLYPDEKGFKIKKSKIRGEVSEGMLCAEDELGLGESHDGIMVLDQQAKVGQAAGEYFKIKKDTVFEIGLTPNRTDAISHYGVARDLAAYLKLQEEVELKKPSVAKFKVDAEELNIPVEVKDAVACPRYSSLTLTEVEVTDSPDWLKDRLKAIGLKPINNVVDVTNYVMNEIGQPLHAFDADKIEGNRVLVKQLSEGSKFTTLDEEERELSSDDLMICNAKEGMCIAGVFGGTKSGVTNSTQKVFLESAYFNSVSIRKTAKRHSLNTDASFRYERGADPNVTIFALKRAALLIQEVSGAKVSSEIADFYPEPIHDHLVELNYQNLDRLIGQHIDKKIVKAILTNLEIEILHESKDGLRLSVPAYRVDVSREVDVIEEVLRIYGYNRVNLPDLMRTSMLTSDKHEAHKIENIIANQLSAEGFAEIFNNSLTNPKYYAEQADLVNMLNPLSKETEVMRKDMLFAGLEAMAFNHNRKRKNLKFYEFGKTYRSLGESKFEETKRLAIWLSGDQHEESWQAKAKAVDFFELKAYVQKCLERLGVVKYKEKSADAIDYWAYTYQFVKGKTVLVELGEVAPKTLQEFDIKENIFYAQFNWDAVLSAISTKEVTHKTVSKFPAVRRDLALLIDTNITFDAIKRLAKDTEKRILKEVNLFDVYEGKNLAEGKKSYGVSFTFQDENKTLTDKQIDKVMDRMIASLKQEIGAELR